MSKFINKKNLILVICIIVLSVVYFFAQKAIDNYVFETESDIYTEEKTNDGEEGNTESSDIISDEELDLVMEESEEGKGDISDEVNYDEKKIYVYITGEVNNPGVLILNEGSRIVDAINAAGGTTANADTSKINLVYVLDDGMKVNIPNKDDLKNDFEYITMNSGDGESSTSETSSSSNNSSSERFKEF